MKECALCPTLIPDEGDICKQCYYDELMEDHTPEKEDIDEDKDEWENDKYVSIFDHTPDWLRIIY